MRFTENKKVIDSIPKEFTGTATDKDLQIKLQALRVLTDMSKSLAIIADTLKAQQKSARRAERPPRSEGRT